MEVGAKGLTLYIGYLSVCCMETIYCFIGIILFKRAAIITTQVFLRIQDTSVLLRGRNKGAPNRNRSLDLGEINMKCEVSLGIVPEALRSAA